VVIDWGILAGIKEWVGEGESEAITGVGVGDDSRNTAHDQHPPRT
jgi:hypothetical protein